MNSSSDSSSPHFRAGPAVAGLTGIILIVAAGLLARPEESSGTVAWVVGAALIMLGLLAYNRPHHAAAEKLSWPTLALAAGPLVALFKGPWAGLGTCCLTLIGLACLYLLSEPGKGPDPLVTLSPQELAEDSSQRNSQIRRLLSTLDELEKAGIQLTGTSTSLAATAREQEASIAEQAAAATQIMATSREINATSRELAHTMEDVAGTADAASQLATVGQDLLTRMQMTMDQTMAAAGGISSKLATLNQRANKIGTVVITISKVADQTNLLSLNAAIEAEKAGEFGRGFGVVATEIRRLADQTAVATLDIEHMIREMLTAVSSGVMGMEKFTEDVRQSAETAHSVIDHLGQIIGQVQNMNERFEQVNYGMRSQAQGAEQITDSIRQLSEATHHTANSIKEFNTAIESLQQATMQLAGTVLRGRAEQGRSA